MDAKAIERHERTARVTAAAVDKMTPAQRGWQTRREAALIRDYHKAFPQWQGGLCLFREMALSLKTGIEQPALVKQREKIEANCAAYDAALAAEHAAPFTPAREKKTPPRSKSAGSRKAIASGHGRIISLTATRTRTTWRARRR